MELWHLWVIAGVALFVAEMFTPGFVVACLGLAALAAAIPAGLGASLTAQVATFSVAAFLLFWRARPNLLRWVQHPERRVRTNVSALIGRTARVAQAIPAGGVGRVVVDGEDWRAEADGGQGLLAETRVRVMRIDGNTLVVEPLAGAAGAREV